MNIDKYPRTFHLPFSPEIHSDDKTIASEYLSNFLNREVVITEKLDGGNTCLWQGKVFARSHSTVANHPSFDPIKGLYSGLQFLIPDTLAVFGENVYAIHSIEYENLTDFFFTFNMLENETWLSWDDVESISASYGLKTVPVLFRGTFKSIKEIQTFMDAAIKEPSAFGKEREGFVIRIADSFAFEDFSKFAAKYVREGHVQTDERWEKNWRAAKIVK